MTGSLLQVEELVKHFKGRRTAPWQSSQDAVRAVDGISFAIEPGETLALVGESGCGKTTTGRLVLRLLDPTSGRITFKNRDVTAASGGELKHYWRSVQAVFQDPWSSLNPRMRAGEIVGEPLFANGLMRGRELRTHVARLLEDVGLEPGLARDYPHEFSGGMRQRLAIARALSLHPALIVLDEPMSSLDVSIGAQIMNLLKDLQQRHDLSYLLIAHDLATVRYLSDRVAVVYLGQIVETAPTENLFSAPGHPYTQALVEAAKPVALDETRSYLLGDVPSPSNPPPGCRFHTRCPKAFEDCPVRVPQLQMVAPGQLVSCHLYDGSEGA
jgi:oligopeptide transport system ATP-binding protein